MIGTTLSHFKITAKLGEGGMGEVYRAEDLKLKREVALKVLPAHLAARPDRLERFQREAETLAALNHPNVVGIYSVEKAEEMRFLIMERVVGHSLGEVIPAEGLAPAVFFDLAVAIAGAMATAHAKGILHRDLKPANVMVTGDGVAKVLDLGLAKLLEESEGTDEDLPTRTASPTALGAVMGTVAYMSPEQAEGKPVGPPSDVFSLGVLFYEMLSGASPFRRESAALSLAAVLHDRPPPIRRLRRSLPRDLERILERCLAKKPEGRYPSAEALGRDLEASRDRYRRRHAGARAVLRRPIVAIPGLVLLIAGFGLSVWLWRGSAHRHWAREVALPEIERLVEASWRDATEAYELAVEAERYIPDDPHLASLLSRCSLNVSMTTEPPGARISVKRYGAPSDEWTYLGTSPLDGVRLPIGILRWKIERPGYDTVLAAASTWDVRPGGNLLANHLARTLDETGTAPPGMVRVAGAATSAGRLPDFYIDRFEVTNRRFQEFVDAGGYRAREYWKHEFVEDGKILTWEEAMTRFVDETERPGPATWQAGAYPEGQADYPVAGISWYEAAAFAEYVGAALPTGFHWGLARGEATTLVRFPQLGGYAIFAPFSNFGGRGPHAVGSLPGITAFGAYDMAGNVREWCANETQDGRLVRGGSWSDATYMFENPSQLPPMDRAPQNGFRCAYYPELQKVPAAALAKIRLPEKRDLYAVEPVPEEIFEIFRERFSYDRRDLDPRIDNRQETKAHWAHETVSYDAAYGGERIIAHLFLPRTLPPPYQTVVYFPGSGALFQESSAGIEDYFEIRVFLSFLMKSGRAVLFPVYKGTFERRDPSLTALHGGDSSHRYTEYLVQLVKDFSRSIDYLETREDIDHDRLAYYGMSWGAGLGAVIPAVEDRLRASVLISGGVAVRYAGRDVAFRPEADPVHYLPRVRVPTLMINGRYDMLQPLEESIRPMFELLGTPPEHKELLLFDTDHIPPRNEFIKGTLSWLDRYLGPVGDAGQGKG